MKTFCSSTFATSVRMASVLVIASLITSPAQAENPLKFLRSKAKQGLSKVGKVVNPRRIGTAVKNAVAGPEPRVPVRRVNPPAGYDEGNTFTEETTYYPDPPTQPRRDSTATNYPDPRVRDLRHYSPVGDSRESGDPAPPVYNTTRLPSTATDRAAMGDEARATRLSPSPGRVSMLQNPDPEAAPANASPGIRDSLSPAAPTERKAAASTKPARPGPTPRQDLPFGELVPGKTGFVYSPYSTKELVDVSGIPTGTKVKCPYSGKTFRVP